MPNGVVFSFLQAAHLIPPGYPLNLLGSIGVIDWGYGSTAGRSRSMGAAPSPPHAGPQHKFALQLSAPEDTPQNIACSSSEWMLLSQLE